MFITEILGNHNGRFSISAWDWTPYAFVFGFMIKPNPVSPVYSFVYIWKTPKCSFPFMLAPVSQGTRDFPWDLWECR